MKRLAVLFGRSPHQRDDFADEADAAEAMDVETYQVDLQALFEEDAERALSAVPDRGRRCFVYRGWMLTGDEYATLEAALEARGHALLTSAEAYARTHYLPHWYPVLAPYTARSVWTDEADVSAAWAAAQALGPPPWILKDHVKSAKEYWDEACFVPAGTDRAGFERRCERLLELREDRFERGFVVRRFLPLRVYGRTDTGGPAHLEFRLFFGHGRLLGAESTYDFDVEVPDFGAYETLAKRVRSPFFAMDLAQVQSGDWALVELNDGGVAQLPASMDFRTLLQALLDSRRA